MVYCLRSYDIEELRRDVEGVARQSTVLPRAVAMGW